MSCVHEIFKQYSVICAALPRCGIDNFARIRRIQCEIGIPPVTRQTYDSPYPSEEGNAHPCHMSSFFALTGICCCAEFIVSTGGKLLGCSYGLVLAELFNANLEAEEAACYVANYSYFLLCNL